MGSFLGAHMLLALMHDLRRQAPRRRGPDLAQAAPRPRQALLRLHRVLDLPHVGPVPGDLVRQPARGDRLRLRAALGPLDPGRPRRCSSACSSSRSAVLLGVAPKKSRADPRLFASISLVGALCSSATSGHAVGDRGERPGLRLPELGPTALFLGLFLVPTPLRPHLPDGLAAAGRDHARPRACTISRSRPSITRIRTGTSCTRRIWRSRRAAGVRAARAARKGGEDLHEIRPASRCRLLPPCLPAVRCPTSPASPRSPAGSSPAGNRAAARR